MRKREQGRSGAREGWGSGGRDAERCAEDLRQSDSSAIFTMCRGDADANGPNRGSSPPKQNYAVTNEAVLSRQCSPADIMRSTSLMRRLLKGFTGTLTSI